MPTYEYRCRNGHTFEVFQKMSDDPVAACPDCGEQAERLLSGGGGFLFKGEGFYITDYRSDEYRKKAQAEKGEAPAGSKGGSDAGTASGDGSSADAGGKGGETAKGGDGGTSKVKGRPKGESA